MEIYNSTELLEVLQNDVYNTIRGAETLGGLTSGNLITAPDQDKWSVAQVLEHLNSYNRYYLAAIEKTLQKKSTPSSSFKPGLFGDYFTKMMNPEARGKQLNKMKSPQDHQPSPLLNAAAVIQEFISGQEQLINLLEKAKQANIGKLKTPISISKFIKLKVGDTFRFLIAHQQRHFKQIERILEHNSIDASVLVA